MTKRGILTNGGYNKKMANLSEKGKFRRKWRVCQKFIKGLAKYWNEMTKRGILTNGDFTKITNLAKNYLRFGKFQTRWQKRHVDNNVGFTKPANLARFCPLESGREYWTCVDNNTTKQAYWQMTIFTKMANLRKWGIGQESINGLAKPQMRCVTKREILTKGKFQQKWRVCQKFIKCLAKYSNVMTKRGMLIVDD